MAWDLAREVLDARALASGCSSSPPCCVPWAGVLLSPTSVSSQIPHRVRGNGPQASSSSRSPVQSSRRPPPPRASYLLYTMFSLDGLILFSPHARHFLC